MLKTLFTLLLFSQVYAANQTSYITTPLPEDPLPFRVAVEQAEFSLPNGLHSFAFAIYKGEWLLISGRTNGLHNVDNTDPSANSFPISNQNPIIYVVNPKTGTIYSRSMTDPASGLTQFQIDLLTVTNSLFYQNGETLYFVGGYGIDTATGTMGTKPALTALDVPNLMRWVKRSSKVKSMATCLRQTFDPLLQVTGGVMWQTDGHHPYLLAFGQNFDGNYLASSNGTYSRQIRPFQIIDNGKDLFIQAHQQPTPLPTYRRRDLNVVPIIKKTGKSYVPAFATLSGVFTPGGGGNPGAWTVPINVNADGSSEMLDLSNANTFAQGVNNYTCANIGLYSQRTNDMYTMLFGGFSYLILSNGDSDNECTASPPAPGEIWTPCVNLPFVNDITTIRIDGTGNYLQYMMSAKFPTIIATFGSGAGTSPIWFGSSAAFLPTDDLPLYSNGIIALDKLKSSRIFLGYIVGGIASSVTDTNLPTDSQASSYIFKVFLEPR